MGCEKFSTDIIDTIFKHANQSLVTRRLQLIEENGVLTGKFDGFLYGGAFYTVEGPNPKKISKLIKTMIAPELRQQAREFQADLDLYHAERTKALHGLITILKACRTRQDGRDMLPTIIAKMSPDLAPLSRTRPVGFLYADSPLSMAQFLEIVDLLELHASNRILV